MRDRQSIKPLTNKVSDSGSYNESLQKERQRRKESKEILKYGGGGVKKLLFGMTSVLFGRDVASKIATKFRDVEKTDQAYGIDRNILDSSRSRGLNGYANPKPSIEKIIDNVEIKKIKDSLDGISSDVTQSLETLGRIESRISPKELTVGRGESAQTFRFDPLAPDGRQVTAVTASGKSGRFASRKEASMVLSKAAYLGAPQTRPTGTIQQLKNTQEVKDLVSLLRQSFDDKVKQEKTISTPKTSRRNEEPRRASLPETYTEFLQEEKDKDKAGKVLRYGGEGFGRKAAFGLTSLLVGEKMAEKVATKFRDEKETQSAFETLTGAKRRNKLIEDSPKGVLPTVSGATKTQLLSAEGKERAKQEELEEEEKEFKEDIIERLERIEEKIDKVGSGGGSFGLGALFGRFFPFKRLAGLFKTLFRPFGKVLLSIATFLGVTKGIDALKDTFTRGGPTTKPEETSPKDKDDKRRQRRSGRRGPSRIPPVSAPDSVTQSPEQTETRSRRRGGRSSPSKDEVVPGKWKNFLKWLEKKSPKVFAKFMTRAGTALAGLAVPGPGWVWTAVSVLGSVAFAWEVYSLYKEFTREGFEDGEEADIPGMEYDEDDPESMRRLEEQFQEMSPDPLIGADIQSRTQDSLRELQRENRRLQEEIDMIRSGAIDSSMAQQQSPQVVALQPIVNNNMIPAPQQQSGATIIHTRTLDSTAGSLVASMYDHPTEHYGLFS